VGPGKTLLRGPITPHSVCLEIERREKEMWGEVSPHHPTRGSGNISSPSGGAYVPPNMDFMHILGQKEAIWNTIFSIFERRQGPPNVAGPGKLSPLSPPLNGPGRDLGHLPACINVRSSHTWTENFWNYNVRFGEF